MFTYLCCCCMKYSERFEYNPEYQSSAQYSTASNFESASNDRKLYQQPLFSVHGVSNLQYEQYNTSQYEQYKYAASNAAASYAQVSARVCVYLFVYFFFVVHFHWYIHSQWRMSVHFFNVFNVHFH